MLGFPRFRYRNSLEAERCIKFMCILIQKFCGELTGKLIVRAMVRTCDRSSVLVVDIILHWHYEGGSARFDWSTSDELTPPTQVVERSNWTTREMMGIMPVGPSSRKCILPMTLQDQSPMIKIGICGRDWQRDSGLAANFFRLRRAEKRSLCACTSCSTKRFVVVISRKKWEHVVLEYIAEENAGFKSWEGQFLQALGSRRSGQTVYCPPTSW